MNSRLLVGAGLRCYINGQPFGRTQSGDFGIEYPRRAVDVLDSFFPAEMIQGATRTTGSLHIYRTHGDGGAQSAGIVAPLADLALEKYFSILILDRSTDTVVFRADQCSMVSERWGLPTRGYVMGVINFMAIGFSNEVASKLTPAL